MEPSKVKWICLLAIGLTVLLVVVQFKDKSDRILANTMAAMKLDEKSEAILKALAEDNAVKDRLIEALEEEKINQIKSGQTGSSTGASSLQPDTRASPINKFCDEDKRRTDSFLSLDPSTTTLDEFAAHIMDPLVTTCREMKRVGGVYLGYCKVFDGHKFVCMDEMPSDDSCLVYSFGVGGDISFERHLSSLGCTIHAFDPTVNEPKNLPANIHFKKLGVMGKEYINNNDQKFMPMLDIFKMNDHESAKIDYLKMDVEGAEITGLPVWIESGAFDNVQQFGIEIHSTNNLANARAMTKSFQALYRKGFRLISFDANLCMTSKKKSHDDHIGWSEVVFARPTVKQCRT